MTTEPLVSIKAATHELGVSRTTLYRMRDDNQISMRKIRGRTLVPMAEIEAIKTGQVAGPSAGTDAPNGTPNGTPKKCRVKKRKLKPMVS